MIPGLEILNKNIKVAEIIKKSKYHEKLSQPFVFRLWNLEEKERFLHLIKVELENSIWVEKSEGDMDCGASFASRTRIVQDIFNYQKNLRSKTEQNSSEEINRKYLEKITKEPLILENRVTSYRAYIIIMSTRPYKVYFHPGYFSRASVKIEKEEKIINDKELNNENINISNKSDKETLKEKSDFTIKKNQFLEKSALFTNNENQILSKEYESIKNNLFWSKNKFEAVVEKERNDKSSEVDEIEKQIKSVLKDVAEEIKTNLLERTGLFEILGVDIRLFKDYSFSVERFIRNPDLKLETPIKSQCHKEILKFVNFD